MDIDIEFERVYYDESDDDSYAEESSYENEKEIDNDIREAMERMRYALAYDRTRRLIRTTQNLWPGVFKCAVCVFGSDIEGIDDNDIDRYERRIQQPHAIYEPLRMNRASFLELVKNRNAKKRTSKRKTDSSRFSLEVKKRL